MIRLPDFPKNRCGRYQMPSGLALVPSLVKAVTFFPSNLFLKPLLKFSASFSFFLFVLLSNLLRSNQFLLNFCQHSSFVPNYSDLVPNFQRIEYVYSNFIKHIRARKCPKTVRRFSIIIWRSISTRTIAVMWWFFTLIMMSSYTANLAG